MLHGYNRVAPSIAAGRLVPWRAGSAAAAACPGGGSCRAGARCPGGECVSRGRGAGQESTVSMLALAALTALRRRAHRAPAPRSPRSGAALRRHARGVALAHRARTLDMRSGGHSNSGSGRSMTRGVAHGCLSDKSVLFHVEHKPGFTVGGPQWPLVAVPAPGGCCCAHPFQAASGRSHG